ncbi:helix-turn-helix domain-containing protein [Bacillus sp. P2(2020)]|uniref:Helix-turn-helix domain-containing protein n=1 Tax=Calidifontibacillus erzurumensis TaxID=2741433 RepID=A0A8J8GD48_9BACI|nr:helix-turn-helix domain-containing protein [Calidifontibacillus erzurumensis]
MARRKIEIIASEETYRNLATFTDINQLNNAVRHYKRQYADQLTNTAVKVLDVLHRYSAKYTGVSFLAKNTIAEIVGVSRRTVIRVCQLLESLGIVKQYEMKRSSDMKQTSNAIVIQPIEELQTTETVTQEATDNSANMSHENKFNSIKTNNINKRIERVDNDNIESIKLDKSFTSDYVPEPFKQLVGAFFNDAATIEEYWRMVRISAYHIRDIYELTDNDVLNLGMESFRQTVAKWRKKRIKTKPIAYFWGVINRKIDYMFFEFLRDNGGHYYVS